MKIYLKRQPSTANATIGTIYNEAGTRICDCLELPWRNNTRRQSCIPVGEYPVMFLPKGSPSFPYPCFLLEDVPGRSAIMIHRGNYPKHTVGCILPGDATSKESVLNSTAALNKLVALKPTSIVVSWA
jgi:hypothetical protein